jgi:hypothetical protein
MAPVNTLANYPGLSRPPGQVLQQRRIAPFAPTAATSDPAPAARRLDQPAREGFLQEGYLPCRPALTGTCPGTLPSYANAAGEEQP